MFLSYYSIWFINAQCSNKFFFDFLSDLLQGQDGAKGDRGEDGEQGDAVSDHFSVYEVHIFLMHTGPYEVFINMLYFL